MSVDVYHPQCLLFSLSKEDPLLHPPASRVALSLTLMPAGCSWWFPVDEEVLCRGNGRFHTLTDESGVIWCCRLLHISFGHHQLAPNQLSLMSAPTKVCLLSSPSPDRVGRCSGRLCSQLSGSHWAPKEPKASAQPSLHILDSQSCWSPHPLGWSHLSAHIVCQLLWSEDLHQSLMCSWSSSSRVLDVLECEGSLPPFQNSLSFCSSALHPSGCLSQGTSRMGSPAAS